MSLLADHDIEGHAALLLGTYVAERWEEFAPLRLITRWEAGLAPNSSDRAVWSFAQAQGLVLRTGNRNMAG